EGDERGALIGDLAEVHERRGAVLAGVGGADEGVGGVHRHHDDGDVELAGDAGGRGGGFEVVDAGIVGARGGGEDDGGGAAVGEGAELGGEGRGVAPRV